MGAPRYNKNAATGTKRRAPILACLCALACPSPALAPLTSIAPSARASSHRADKKAAPHDTGAPVAAQPWFATLRWVHDGTSLAIRDDAPSPERFERLVADRISGESHPMDARLLALLRTVAAAYPRGRIELVSGFRSPKFNEMLRKKGHKVASQSQHSDGHAVDFRIFPENASEPLDPFEVEIWLRSELHWNGGIGVYPIASDRFVHADVGKERRWVSR